MRDDEGTGRKETKIENYINIETSTYRASPFQTLSVNHNTYYPYITIRNGGNRVPQKNRLSFVTDAYNLTLNFIVGAGRRNNRIAIKLHRTLGERGGYL